MNLDESCLTILSIPPSPPHLPHLLGRFCALLMFKRTPRDSVRWCKRSSATWPWVWTSLLSLVKWSWWAIESIIRKVCCSTCFSLQFEFYYLMTLWKSFCNCRPVQLMTWYRRNWSICTCVITQNHIASLPCWQWTRCRRIAVTRTLWCEVWLCAACVLWGRVEFMKDMIKDGNK